MTQYIDAVLHIADYPALAAAMAQAKPGSVVADGSIQGFTATPVVWTDEDGQPHEATPPFGFGGIA